MKWTHHHEIQMSITTPQSVHPPALDDHSGLRSRRAEHRLRRAILKKLAWRLNNDRIRLVSPKAIGQKFAWGGQA